MGQFTSEHKAICRTHGEDEGFATMRPPVCLAEPSAPFWRLASSLAACCCLRVCPIVPVIAGGGGGGAFGACVVLGACVAAQPDQGPM